MKHIVKFPVCSGFPVELICGIAFGSASSVVVLLNLFQSTYKLLQNKDNLVDYHLGSNILDQ